MTGEELERAITFLIEHHAKVSANMERHSEEIVELNRKIERNSDQIAELTRKIERNSEQIDAMRVEMREGFENLIIANEVTRKLSEDVARLTMQNSQRITKLEEKVS